MQRWQQISSDLAGIYIYPQQFENGFLFKFTVAAASLTAALPHGWWLSLCARGWCGRRWCGGVAQVTRWNINVHLSKLHIQLLATLTTACVQVCETLVVEVFALPCKMAAAQATRTKTKANNKQHAHSLSVNKLVNFCLQQNNLFTHTHARWQILAASYSQYHRYESASVYFAKRQKKFYTQLYLL